MAEDFGGQLGQMWRSVYAQARQIATEEINRVLGNIVRGGKVLPGAIAAGPPGTVLTSPSGGGGTTWTAGASGSVTSVGLTAPAELVVGGSPITGAGTLTFTKAVQAAGTSWMGPLSGTAPPTFRAITPADLPVATGLTLGIVRGDGTTITNVGGVLSAPGAAVVITTQGDTIVGGSAGTPARLALGTAGQVPSPVGADVAWVTPVDRGGLIDVTKADGDLLYRSYAAVTALGIGYIGDSITAGSSLSGGNSPAQASATALSAYGLTVTATNQGVSGSNTSQWVPGAVSGYYATAKAAFAAAGVKVVQIMLGTNDCHTSVNTSVAQYATNVQAMVADLVHAGYTVVLAYPPYTTASGRQLTLLSGYLGVLDTLVDGYHVRQGDTGAYTYFRLNPSTLQADALHPTQAGSDYLGGTLWARALRQLVAAATGPQTLQRLVPRPP